MSERNSQSVITKSPRYFYGYNIVILCFIIMILIYGIRTTFGVFFKPIEAEFGWSRALISGAVTLSMIVQGLWGIYMGRINDKFGSRWVITVCSFFTGIGLILIYFTAYSWELYVFYGLIVGIGLGGVFVAILSTVTRWFIKKRGLMSGIVLAGIGLGTLTFAPLCNWLITLCGWRMANVIIGLSVLVIGITAAQFLKRDPAQMGLLPYGQTEGKAGQRPQAKGMTLKESFRTWQFWVIGVVFASLGYCTFTVSIHLVPHITDLGFAAAAAALVLAISGGVQSFGGIIFGFVADKIGNRAVMIINCIIIAASLFWLVPIDSLTMFYLVTIIYSIGIGGGTAMESTITADLFGLKSHGVILGAISFGFTIGAAIGPVVTGYLYDRFGNYQVAFITAGAAAIIGVLLTAILKPVKKPEAG